MKVLRVSQSFKRHSKQEFGLRYSFLDEHVKLSKEKENRKKYAHRRHTCQT
jgi:hypothetical protein